MSSEPAPDPTSERRTTDDPFWDGHEWLNPPARFSALGGTLSVTTRGDSDFWRVTHEGFVKDDGHFFGRAIEGDFVARVRFSGAFSAQYDQAGLMVRASPERWMKCGIELTDGRAYASVVLTDGRSDWSLVPLQALPDSVTIEVTHEREALLVRCLQPLGELLRVTPFRDEGPVLVGPMCASPKGAGFEVTFEEFSLGALVAR